MSPRPRLLWLFAAATAPFLVPLLLGLTPAWTPEIAWLGRMTGWLANGLVVTAALLDLLRAPRLRRVEAVREAPEVMSVGARNAVRVWLTNRNTQPLTITVEDEPPTPNRRDGLPLTITLGPQQTRHETYHVFPLQRGRNRFGELFLRTVTPWGLWRLDDVRPLAAPVEIYPDIQAVHGMELLARKNRLAETGLKMSRLRGRGNDFDRLREYRREDEYRSIDWKATARHQDLISREYVVERNQNILIALDCGRAMCNEQGGISHFDRCLNAAIALSYVALRQGDYVGLYGFSNKVERWVRPVRGTGGIQTLIRQTYDLQPRYEATDYRLMVDDLRKRYRKRSLVILLTYAIDELSLESIGRHLQQLRNPHLVLGSFVKNVPLDDRLAQVPETDLEAFQIGAAAELQSALARQVAALHRSGLLMLESRPDQLTANVISRYLDVKARHLL